MGQSSLHLALVSALIDRKTFMRALEKILIFLIPTLQIPPRWRLLWKQEENGAFLASARVFCAFFCLAYIGHYFFVDLPLHKEPRALWATYRFGCAAASLLALLLTFYRPLQRSDWLERIPIAVLGLLFSYAQAQSMIWRAEVPYAYAIVLPVVAGIALRSSIFVSAAYLLLAFGVEHGGWQARTSEGPYLWSAAVVGMILVAVIRSRMTADVRAFLSEQRRIEDQKKIIEKEIELNAQIRSFLPKVIYERFDHEVRVGNKTVLQAIDEVLRGKRMLVACLYSDIRSFTQKTKTISRHLQESLIPNMRTCTDVVEENNGIPRQIGDLIFAYFDSASPIESFRRSLECAVQILDKTLLLNQGQGPDAHITRYVLLAFGEAVVGNTGGSRGSREVTVIGRPANLLARIDALTKEKVIEPLLARQVVVLTQSSGEMLNELSADFETECLDLDELQVSIRDFPEEKKLYLFPLTEHNRQLLGKSDSRSTPLEAVA